LTKPSISVRMNSGVQSRAQLSVALRDVRKPPPRQARLLLIVQGSGLVGLG
jgi:hypothetical protein